MKSIIYWGIEGVQLKQLKRKIITSNVICVATILLVSLFNLIVGFIHFQWELHLGLLSHCFLLAVSMFLIKSGRNKIGRGLISIASLYFVGVIAVVWGSDSFGDFILIPIMLLPFMMFMRKEIIPRTLYVFGIGVFWFFVQWIYKNFNPIHLIDADHLLIIQSIFIFLSFTWTSIMLLTLTRSSQED